MISTITAESHSCGILLDSKVLQMKTNENGRFIFTPDYIHYEDPILEHRQIICSRFNFIGRSHNRHGCCHGIIIDFTDPDGFIKKFRILNSALQGNGRLVRSWLSNHGFYICPDTKARSLFNLLLISKKVDAVFQETKPSLSSEPILFIEVGSELDESFKCI